MTSASVNISISNDMGSTIVSDDIPVENMNMNMESCTPSVDEKKEENDDEERYRYLVVDSGPIIKHAGIRNLFGKAEAYVTVPGVLNEIRDGKARAHLEQWPMELQVKSPTPESIQQMIAFSKQTGDYASLSKVDLEVLALVLDLEKEGCATLDHIRDTPKRMIGLGNIQSLKKEHETKTGQRENQDKNENKNNDSQTTPIQSTESVDSTDNMEETENNQVDHETPQPEHQPAVNQNEKPTATPTTTPTTPQPPKSWAMLVNPSTASKVLPHVETTEAPSSMDTSSNTSLEGGQFSDAEDSEDDESHHQEDNQNSDDHLQKELESDFPSLVAAATVPYEGSDDENEGTDIPQKIKSSDEEALIQKKMQALQPISKSGKMYNSFRKYGDLMKPKPAAPKKTTPSQEQNATDDRSADQKQLLDENEQQEQNNQQSKIIGSGAMASSEDMGWDEDDGEGWVTCKSDIVSMKNNGSFGGPQRKGPGSETGPVGPPKSDRTACTTTDFAMQNVLLQMGLDLLSVDGVKIRRVKSWVHRCGACFKIHTDAEFYGMKRMFCSHCGSDMMQRIAASVDGKTGRLKLHLSKKHKNNLRGTKFSLPKPGSGNRFQGDLLLREDQLLTGAWNQKVKIRTGGKSRANAQSIFGKDLASNVGCDTKMLSTDDVRVGFGRRNPNSVKGRERRGKKKKSSDRACGLRRY